LIKAIEKEVFCSLIYICFFLLLSFVFILIKTCAFITQTHTESNIKTTNKRKDKKRENSAKEEAEEDKNKQAKRERERK
jgi:cytoskeletal protein RodZ